MRFTPVLFAAVALIAVEAPLVAGAQAWIVDTVRAPGRVVEFTATTGATRAALRLGQPVHGSSIRRRFMVRRQDTFARWLLSFGGDLVPISPREVVDAYRGLVRETLTHHGAA